jgi:NAD(P)-dependent dehydrogenase (short-subunit alcohol dehydrogenase family)
MTPFTGMVAIVTGGSRGIGLAIARALVERGTHVAIGATSDATLSAAAADLQRSARDGAHVLPVRTDVRRYEDVEHLFEAALQKFGGLDVLINNAGIGVFRRVAEMSVNDWHRVIDTNLTGVFYCCHAALPHLRARGGGWIINISSLSSVNPFPEGAAYCASKTALNAFSEALMQEVRHDGIRVSYVLPGSVRTDFSGRPHGDDQWKLAPVDVADVVADVIKHPARSLPSRVDIRPAKPPKKA